MKAKARSWHGILSALAALAMLPAEAAIEEFDLPAWESDSESASFSPGGGLWPDEPPPPATAAALQKKSPSEKRLAEFVLLRREKIPPVEPPAYAEVVDDLPELEGELLQQYFERKPANFLLDPQGLITEQKANDVLRFLEYHSEVSRFGIYPVVLGHNQHIPENIDLNQVHKEWFGPGQGGDPLSILVVYHLLDPESLQIFYNPSVTDKVPATHLSVIRKNVIEEARRADNSSDQLEKIAIEMSIQAFLLEKLLDGKPINLPAIEWTAGEAVDPPALVVEVEVPLPVEREDSVALEENAPGPLEVSAPETVSAKASPGLVKWIVGGSLAVLFLGFVYYLKGLAASRRMLRNQPVLFPGYVRQERLGGEFTGGAFVGISFELGRTHGRID